jgi:hypothetical protein
MRLKRKHVGSTTAASRYHEAVLMCAPGDFDGMLREQVIAVLEKVRGVA